MTNSTNPQLEDGFIRIANGIAKQLAKTYMSSYESQIVWCLFIKTYGFNKKEDWISNSQFVKATGILKTHVSRTIKKLLSRKIVTQTGNKIAFQKDNTLWCKLPKQVTNKKLPKQVTQLPKQVTPVTQTGNTVTHLGNHNRHYTIDTITKDTIQKKYSSIKNLDQTTLKEIANKYKVPLSFVKSKLDDMTNWLESKGKKYKNYKAALSNWVKTDALKIIQKERQNVKNYKPTEIQI